LFVHRFLVRFPMTAEHHQGRLESAHPTFVVFESLKRMEVLDPFPQFRAFVPTSFDGEVEVQLRVLS